MPQEFRYPLTRYCLRGGALTLPRAMVGLFPESGEVTAVDTRSEAEHTLTVVDPRTVTGLGPIFKQHRMAVNDELLIRPLEDGRFSITAVKRDHQPDYSSSEAVEQVLDELIAASVPVTEAELRALYPGIPADLGLAAILAADERFVRREGRWHNALSLAFPLEPASAAPRNHDAPDYAAVGSAALSDAATQAFDTTPSAHDGARPQVQAGLWQQDAVDAGPAGSTGDTRETSPGPTSGTVLERRQPAADPGRGRRDHDAHDAGGQRARAGDAAFVVDEGRAGSGPDIEVDRDADEGDGGSLEVTELSNRLRAVLAGIGFRIEAVARGQLLLTADMGRKSYTVLAQLLTRSERLDWADLLARRRSTNVRYLAVFGDHRALVRLTNPAELARATLWSWQALDRLSTLSNTVSFSPIELESHFERDGLFEKGLQRFEATVAKLVAERGAMSELLTRLAVMRAPSVFMLEDLAGELKVPRDRLLKQLELLSEAPFHLVAKVDMGEFVLRQRVADSLSGLASYATSLRERLPGKQVEKLTGLAEPDLLTEDELDYQVSDGLNSLSAT